MGVIRLTINVAATIRECEETSVPNLAPMYHHGTVIGHGQRLTPRSGSCHASGLATPCPRVADNGVPHSRHIPGCARRCHIAPMVRRTIRFGTGRCGIRRCTQLPIDLLRASYAPPPTSPGRRLRLRRRKRLLRPPQSMTAAREWRIRCGFRRVRADTWSRFCKQFDTRRQAILECAMCP